MTWMNRLDCYGTDAPGFNEGHPEDRCPVCEWPVVDHRHSSTRVPARWPHRRAAAVALLGEWWDRTIQRLIGRR